MKPAIHKIERRLALDPILAQICLSRPAVYELPYMQSNTLNYIAVWMHMREDELSWRNIRQAIATVCDIMNKGRLLRGYRAVDIVLYVGDNAVGEGRILRASVNEDSLGAVVGIAESDINGHEVPGCFGWYGEPIDGVKILWYRDPSLIPIR